MFCDKYLLVSGIIGAIKRFERWISQIRSIENARAKSYSYSIKVSVLECVLLVWETKEEISRLVCEDIEDFMM